MNTDNKQRELILGFSLFLIVALLSGHVWAAACELDWDGDGAVEIEDLLGRDPLRGYYAEFFTLNYYPTTYADTFPDGDPERVDFNGDGTLDTNDLLGPADPAADSEGFYVEWFFYLYFPDTYCTYVPNQDACAENVCITWSCDLSGDEQEDLIAERSMESGPHLYPFDVAMGSPFTLHLRAISGDADIKLRAGELPTTTEYDCNGSGSGDHECVLPAVAADSMVYLEVYCWSGSGCDFDLTACYESSGGNGCVEGDADGDLFCDNVDTCAGFDDSQDRDGDRTPDGCDGCPDHNDQTTPAPCATCGEAWWDSDGDGLADCIDSCPDDPDNDIDGDGLCVYDDPCQTDATNSCWCDTSEGDRDGDGIGDVCDGCPDDPYKGAPGICGCGDRDADGDGICDVFDNCWAYPDTLDNDEDGVANKCDACPESPTEQDFSHAGSDGVCDDITTCDDTDDSDGDGWKNCSDECPGDPLKVRPGSCGCGESDADSDGDSIPDCDDNCVDDPLAGICPCGTTDLDIDGDGDGFYGAPDCYETCIFDPGRTSPYPSGCADMS